MVGVLGFIQARTAHLSSERLSRSLFSFLESSGHHFLMTDWTQCKPTIMCLWKTKTTGLSYHNVTDTHQSNISSPLVISSDWLKLQLDYFCLFLSDTHSSYLLERITFTWGMRSTQHPSDKHGASVWRLKQEETHNKIKIFSRLSEMWTQKKHLTCWLQSQRVTDTKKQKKKRLSRTFPLYE